MTQGEEKPNRDSSADAWREVGQRLEALGNSIAAAFQEAWHNDANQQAVREVESGLKSAARAVADTVDEAMASPEGQKLRQDTEEAVRSAHQAGKQAVDEARPQLIAALESLRKGLQSAIDDLQRGSAPSGGPAAPPNDTTESGKV